MLIRQWSWDPPGKFTFHAEIELPDGFSPVLPVPDKVSYKKDFADYSSEYSLSGATLKVDRNVVTSVQEVPAKRRAEYITFRKSVADDESRFINANDHNLTGPSITQNEQALRLYQQALGALQFGSAQQSIDFARQAIALEPDYPLPYRVLALGLMRIGKGDEALEPLRKYQKMVPNDPTAPYTIGSLLLGEKRPAEAIPELEAAVKWFPDNSAIATELGQAYIRSGNAEKGVSLLKATAERDASPLTLNNVAYELAEQNISLDDALIFSEKAVEQVEADSAKIDADNLNDRDWQATNFLQSFWDTLGWVHFQLKHYDQAEKYLRVSWILDRNGAAADHLAQTYEKEGKKQEAIHIYALSAARGGPNTRQIIDRVDKLAGDAAKGADIILAAQKEYRQSNILRIPRLIKGSGEADFAAIFTQGTSSPELRFMNGSEDLRSAGAGIESIKFDMRFPDGRAAKIVRRGHLSCPPAGPTCDFVLFAPNMARLTN